MSKGHIQLDAEGRLDLAAVDAPFSPGDLVEFYVQGDELVLKQCPAVAERRGRFDRRADRPDDMTNFPRR